MNVAAICGLNLARSAIPPETIAGIAGPRPKRASALNHKLRDYAVESQPIIEWPLHFLPGPRILEFLRSFRKADKIRDGLRGFFFEQADDNRSL